MKTAWCFNVPIYCFMNGLNLEAFDVQDCTSIGIGIVLAAWETPCSLSLALHTLLLSSFFDFPLSLESFFPSANIRRCSSSL